jgi:PKD repeat protein
MRYDWRFSSANAWHNNSGPTPMYAYGAAGVFTVTLRVFDGGGNSGTNTTTAIISVEAVNQPPTAPRVTGPTIGVKRIPYAFSFVSTD